MNISACLSFYRPQDEIWKNVKWNISRKVYMYTYMYLLLEFKFLAKFEYCFNNFQFFTSTRCVDGFYGDPMTTGLACTPCSLNCNGNLDTSSPGSCDTYTGACLLCREGSAGDHCQRCALGFYGDAIQRTCQG